MVGLTRVFFLLVLLLAGVTGESVDAFAQGDGGQSAQPGDNGGAPSSAETGQATDAAGDQRTKNPGDEDHHGKYEQLIDDLLMLALITLILEQAYTTLFNSRRFAAFLEGQAFKTPFIIISALVVTNVVEINILASVMEGFGEPFPDGTFPTGLGFLLTGLVLAGGNDAVYRIFSAVNLRKPSEGRAFVKQQQRTMAKVRIEMPPSKFPPLHSSDDWAHVLVDGATVRSFPRHQGGVILYLDPKVKKQTSEHGETREPVEQTIQLKYRDKDGETQETAVERHKLMAQSDIIIVFQPAD